MAESTLSATYESLVREVSNFLGLGAVYATGTVAVASGVVTLTSGSFPTWAASAAINIAGTIYNVSTRDSATQLTLTDTSVTVGSGAAYVLLNSIADDEAEEFRRLDHIIEEGLRSFYVAASQQGAFPWSFLDVNASLSLTNGDFDYDLPDDFGQRSEGWAFAAGTANSPLLLVDESVVRMKRSQESTTGTPKYVAVREKTFDPTVGQRFEAVFHPTPGSSMTVDYRYGRVPNKLTPANKYPLGGALHSATIIAACLAAADARENETQGVYAARFQERLAASMQLDSTAKQAANETFTQTAATYGTYQWLAQEAGRLKGYGPNYNLWNDAQVRDVDVAIQEGYRQYVTPPAMGGGEGQPSRPHSWSFLDVNASLSLTNGDFDYDLPADFGQSAEGFVFAAGTANTPLQLVDESVIRAKRSQESASGVPKYVAVREKTFDATTGQRFEAVFHPTPSSSLTVDYRYVRTAPSFTTTNNYPLGGDSHFETLLASVLMVVDLQKAQPTGAYTAKFQERLTASIQQDLLIREKYGRATYSNTAATYGTYQWLQQEVGKLRGFGPNPNLWTHLEVQDADTLIQAGYRRFLTPQPMMRESADPRQGQKPMPAYEWSFLDVVASLSLTNTDYDYDLAADCGQRTTGWAFTSGSANTPLQLVDESVIRMKRSQESATGVPKYVAVREKTFDPTVGQRFEAIFHPTPSSSLTVDYRYNRTTPSFTTTNNYPLGGELHFETLVESVLAVAEESMPQSQGMHAAKFQERLAASIQRDMLAKQEDVGTYSNTAVTYGTYDWLAQEIGKVKGYGANAKLWTHPQVQEVDTIIQRGYQLFLMPVITGISRQPHRWSFLRPLTSLTLNASYSTGTITVVDGVVTLASGTFPSWAASGDVVISGVAYSVNTRDSGTQVTLDDTTVDADAGTAYSLQQTVYELPSDFGGIDGPLTYQRGTSIFFPPIEIVAESKLRIVATEWNSSGQPRYAALRPRTLSNSTGTRWDLVLWPPSDTAYLLFYRYKAVQPATLATGQYPMGGTVHAETILASCLSLVDPNRAADFQQKLASSIALDQSEHSPETVGMNFDRSEGGMSSVRDGAAHGRDSDYVRFEGVLYD